MKHLVARTAAVLSIVAGAMLTTACLVPPTAPAPPQSQPPETQPPAETQPGETQAPEETDAPAETQAAPEPSYEIVADGQDGSSWSFEIGEVRVVETDATGSAAEPGRQLVEVEVNGQLLAGEPDFYRAFHMYLVDADGGEWGLSSGSSFYVDGDLYTTGTEPEFSGVGIFHVPTELTYEHVRFTTDDGWTQDVEW